MLPEDAKVEFYEIMHRMLHLLETKWINGIIDPDDIVIWELEFTRAATLSAFLDVTIGRHWHPLNDIEGEKWKQH